MAQSSVPSGQASLGSLRSPDRQAGHRERKRNIYCILYSSHILNVKTNLTEVDRKDRYFQKNTTSF